MHWVRSVSVRKFSGLSKTAAISTPVVWFAANGHSQAASDQPALSWLQAPCMFGDWGGEQTKLQRKGVTFSFLPVNDFLADGRGDQANWSRVRGTMDVDSGQAELVPGLTFHITALWQGGDNLGAYIGSVANPGSLVSADYESFDAAGSPAAEIRIAPSKHFYLKSAIFSGNRNPYHDDTTGLHLRFRDSPVIATEAGYLVNPSPSATGKSYPGVYKLGATTNPGPFLDIVYSQITGGFRYHGLISRRRRDTLAAGIVYSRISPKLNQAYTAVGLLPFGSEEAVEINYSYKVSRWFAFQPVVQYHFDTGQPVDAQLHRRGISYHIQPIGESPIYEKAERNFSPNRKQRV